ncbi:MAG TPA: MBL fold metallo-hydrolase [Humisphaera sp.]
MRRTARPTAWIRTATLAVVAALALFAPRVAAAAAPTTAPAGKLVLTILDIPDVQRGAGLAVILQLPSGKTCLYDTGAGYPDRAAPDGWVAGYNTGRDQIAPFLKARGVDKVDTVFMSHAHYDHFGGLVWLKDNVRIGRLVDSGFSFGAQSTPAYSGELGHYDKVRDEFRRRGAYLEAHTGDVIAVDPLLKVEVLAPPKEFFRQAYAETRAKNDPPAHYLVNANSLGMRITYGKVTFLLPGDIQDVDQARSLVPSLPAGALKCDVLVAPGHGLHAAKEFAEAARPQVALCSVFPRYAKGLPAHKVYAAVGAKVWVTGLHGQLEVTCDGQTYEVKVEHPQGKPATRPATAPAR